MARQKKQEDGKDEETKKIARNMKLHRLHGRRDTKNSARQQRQEDGKGAETRRRLHGRRGAKKISRKKRHEEY